METTMLKIMRTLVLTLLVLGAFPLAITLAAPPDCPGPGYGYGRGNGYPCPQMQGMAPMMQGMQGMPAGMMGMMNGYGRGTGYCPNCAMGHGRYRMGGYGNPMMMGRGQGWRGMTSSYLGRAAELGLSAAQVEQLQSIHSACRRDMIRLRADEQVARLDLADLLRSKDWTPDAAEKLVRKQQALAGDLRMRQIQAMAAARQVLTAEQLQKAAADAVDEDPEDLF